MNIGNFRKESVEFIRFLDNMDWLCRKVEKSDVFYYNEWFLNINLFCFNVIGEFFLYKILILKVIMFGKMMKYVYIDYIYVKLLVWKIKFVLINFIGCYIEFCIFLMINCLCILLNSILYFILLMYVFV